MTSEQKKWIDDSSYATLLNKWRNAPSGDPFFQRGPLFDYYKRVMGEKKVALLDNGVAASKSVGWG